ncbi:FliH/SctL family protein [Ferrimonas lipolytica]|uniref:Flagellar assembly protein FliH n=1 Tax=Ferrimonas lipolytica TaxID=2724191 RepID=A0A6H1UF18_9GAMM|nr:FliH/SctL family protein [Ferrimonas lipolytica]QIZ76806.1 hypothetical protein HER31_07905 [Ferrimonas lipolytica]
MNQSSWRLANVDARNYRFMALDSEQQSQWSSYQDAIDKGYQAGLEQGTQEGLQQGQKQGYQQGKKEGYLVGEAQGLAASKKQSEQELLQLTVPIEAIKQQLLQHHQQQLVQQQQVIIALVQQICDKVIRQELQLQPERIVPLIEDTLASLPSGAQQVRVRLHPATHKAIAALPQLAAWQLDSDPELNIGDLIVETEQSEADASAELRLQACMEKLVEHLTCDRT